MKSEREAREQKTFKDPVCGMQVSYKTAAAESTYRGKRYYFCADVCRETFDAAPERYAGGHGNRSRR